MNYYPLHIGDYLRDTSHLSMLEDGAYRRMLDLYYASERPLPVNLDGLFRLLRARSKAEKDAVVTVLEEFFQRRETGWHNPRADAEIARAHEKSAKARASAELSVKARASTNRELRSDRMAEAKRKGTHTEGEWHALVAFCGSKCVRCSTIGKVEKDHIVPVYKGGSDAIENLQPLCAGCNKSKGPEAIDHRPPGWAEAVRSANAGADAERTLSERSAPNNQEPRTKNQKPKASASDSSSESSAETTLPATRRAAADTGGTTVETWNAYAFAYQRRYGAEPLRNAKVNGMLAKFLQRVPMAEAPDIAAFYVGHSKGLYVSAKHCVDLMLRDAEGLRTEWVTGRKVTDTEARAADRTASTVSQVERLIEKHAEQEVSQ